MSAPRKRSPAKKMALAEAMLPKGAWSSLLRVVRRPENQLSLMEKMEVVENGISKESLESLKALAGLDYDQLARILNVARATLINKKSPERFNTDLSDKIMSLADIFSYGFQVFEDKDRFRLWIRTPLKALGGKAPGDLLNTSFGREEVRNLIGRMEYGVYS